jgi:hypothetical protein
VEGTLTEIGSKWSKKKKRRRELRENELLDENIEDNRSTRKEDGSWTTQQEKKSTNECLGVLHEKEGKAGWRSPKNASQVDLGFWSFRVLTPSFRPKVVRESL